MKTYCSQKKKVVITGGAGFIGHHVVEHLLRKTNWEIYILDKLSYASFGLERLRNCGAYPSPRVKVFPIDVTLPLTVGIKKEIGDVATAKYETEPVDVDGERKYKLIITGISADQRKKLFIKKAMLKEEMEFDLDLHLMQKRAGL